MGLELFDASDAYGYDIKAESSHNYHLSGVFDGSITTRFFAQHWELPLIAIGVYCLMLVVLPPIMKDREAIKPRKLISIWNFGLAIFSWCGAYCVIPHLLYGPCGHMGKETCGLISGSMYKSMCTHATWYGHGNAGMFTALFIASKIPELVDTFWLIIGKSPVILLHWYHHISVLMYCWHAYAFQTSIGIYFAGMNYCVHAIMYSYYAMTQWSLETRAIVKPFAMAITFLQIAQMFGGIFVVCMSQYYKYGLGLPCSTTDSNTVAAILMYISYCILFIQLFVGRYAGKKKKRS